MSTHTKSNRSGRRARRSRILSVAIVGVALTLGSLAVAEAEEPTASGPRTENVATRWVQRALDAVRTGSPALHTSTPGAARTYAMTAAAMYDAVNGIDSANATSKRGPALLPGYADAPVGANRDAAASTAAHAVLSTLFASNAAVSGALDGALGAELAALGSGPAVEAGREWGMSVGQQVLSLRADDGTVSPESLDGGSGPGVFPRRFSSTQFRHMAPFGVATTEPFASAGPPPLASPDYADAFNEVKTLGSSTDTHPERAAVARHWLAEGGTVRETGLWLKVALSVVADQGTTESLSETVRLFALLTMGIADSVTVSWGDKFDWQYWRPGDAIRQASADGNPATVEDASWNPRNGTCASAVLASCPIFGGTPEHTSGTSMFAGSSSAILASFYCTDKIAFSFTGDQVGSPPRAYGGFREAALEAGRSRIYGGIHFQFSNESGREAGREIGREIVRTRLVPDGSRPQPFCIP